VERAFVIGGTETFSSALGSQMLQGVYVTRILTADVECDSRVVPFSMQEFSLVEEDAARTEGSWRYVLVFNQQLAQAMPHLSCAERLYGCRFKHEHYERRQTETRTVRTTTTTTTTTTNTTNSASSRGDANSKDGDGGAQTNSGGAPAATTTSSGKQRRPHKPRSPRTSRPGRRRQRTAQSRSRSPRTRTSPRPRRRRGQKKEPKLMGPLQPVVPRQRVVQDTPGPGAYEVEASIGRQVRVEWSLRSGGTGHEAVGVVWCMLVAVMEMACVPSLVSLAGGVSCVAVPNRPLLSGPPRPNGLSDQLLGERTIVST